jgi:hypothetical protein
MNKSIQKFTLDRIRQFKKLYYDRSLNIDEVAEKSPRFYSLKQQRGVYLPQTFEEEQSLNSSCL